MSTEFTGEYVSASSGTRHIIEGDKITDTLLTMLGIDPKGFDIERAADRNKLIREYAKHRNARP